MEKRSFVPQETRMNKVPLPAGLPETGVIFDGRLAPQQGDSVPDNEIEKLMAQYDAAYTLQNLIK